MARYSEDVIQQLKSHADMVQIVQKFVPLRRRGSNWVGLCPFHDDSSPSMYITPNMGIYKCFACGAGGDVLKFVMDHERMDFISALEFVAAESHFPLPALTAEDASQLEEQAVYLKLHHLAEEWFAEQLRHNPEAQQYLQQRQISPEIQREFALGWAPQGSQGLLQRAQQQGFSAAQLIAAGLAVQRESGEIADKFRNRLIFAIRNLSGKTIAFGGRIIVDNPHAPKYLNSPETPLYTKGQVLYGLNLARNEIAKSEEALVVEGYFDVISLHQGGLTNVVAASGTALTAHHGRILSRYAKKIFLLFDGDDAGRTAARRSLEVLLPLNLTIRVLLFPQGTDPDDLVKSQGAEGFSRYINEKSLDVLDFLSITTPRHSPEEKAQFLHGVRQVIALIKDPILRQEYLNLAAQRFEVARQNLVSAPPPTGNAAVPYEGALRVALPNLEARFLKLMLVSPKLWPYLNAWFEPEIFTAPLVAEILDLGLAHFEEVGAFNLVQFIEQLSPAEKEAMVALPDEKWTDLSMMQEFLASLIQMYGVFMQNLRGDLQKNAAQEQIDPAVLASLRMKIAKVLKNMNELKVNITKSYQFDPLYQQWSALHPEIYALIAEIKLNL